MKTIETSDGESAVSTADTSAKKGSCLDVNPFSIQVGEVGAIASINDFKNKFLTVAFDTNPVLAEFNISTCQLFKEFQENSYIDPNNLDIDYEGFLAVDLYSTKGYQCGILALGRQKGDYKCPPNRHHVIGQSGVAVFNKHTAHAKMNYCTDRLEVALKIAQCGERVAFAEHLSSCIEFFLNTTNNTPILVDISENAANAYSFFDSDEIIDAKDKMAVQTYLHQLYTAFTQKHGIVEEDTQVTKVPTDTINIVNMNDIEALPIQWLWPGWLPLGKVTILAGSGGCGKTTLSLALISTITTGGCFPDGTRCEKPGKVLIYSTEDDPADTLKPRLIANGADVSQVSIIAGRTNQKGKIVHFDPAKDFPDIERYIIENPDLKLLMIDPIISAISGDTNKANDVRRSLQPLVDLASQYGFSILGITHFAKGSMSNNPADRILGSQAFSALPRMAWCAARREAEGDYILARAKSNNSTLEGGIRYQIEPVEILNEIETTKTTWLGTIEGFAKELLNSAELSGSDNNSVVDTAKAFLIELLSTVERMSSKEVQAQAKEAGFSPASIRRAQERLNIKPFRPHGEKGWFWSLPKIHRLDEPSNF